MKIKNTIIAGAAAMALASSVQAEEHEVILTGFSYFPSIVYVSSGDTVRFINESGDEQTVVAKDANWVVGPLGDLQDGTLVVTEETELQFYSAFGEADCANNHEGTDGVCGFGSDPTVEEQYGDYEDAEVKAEITFDSAPLNDTAQLND